MSVPHDDEVIVPLVDVAWQHRQVRERLDAALDRLLTDPSCDDLPFVQGLERQFGELVEGRHCVAVHSGLAGEFLLLRAAGIGAGDEVITAPNSDLATTAAISHSGARFVLVDIDPATHNLDPNQVEAAITPRTRAIIPVHMYGLPAELDELNEIARRHNLLVIEDATLALGASYRGRPAGTLGDAAFFSFAPRKVIGGAGNGGMVVTGDAELARGVRLLRAYGLDPARSDLPAARRQSAAGADHLAEGYNLKLDGIQAAIVGEKLRHLADWRARRQAVADDYTARLAAIPGVAPPIVPAHMQHAWRNYVVRVPERDRVRVVMRQQGIATSVLYTPPVHLQAVYRDLGYSEGDFPRAEAVARELLALPMHPGLDRSQTAYVADALAAALDRAGG